MAPNCNAGDVGDGIALLIIISGALGAIIGFLAGRLFEIDTREDKQ